MANTYTFGAALISTFKVTLHHPLAHWSLHVSPPLKPTLCFLFARMFHEEGAFLRSGLSLLESRFFTFFLSAVLFFCMYLSALF